MAVTSVDGLLGLDYKDILGAMAQRKDSSYHREESSVPARVLCELLISLLKNDERSGELVSKAEAYRRRMHEVRPTYEPCYTERVILDELKFRKTGIYTPGQLMTILAHVTDSDCMYESDYCNVCGTFDSIGALLEYHLEFVEFKEEHIAYFRERLKEAEDSPPEDTWRLLCYIGADSALELVRESLLNPELSKHVGFFSRLAHVGHRGGDPEGATKIEERGKLIYQEFNKR